jgi:hypothetical protein
MMVLYLLLVFVTAITAHLVLITEVLEPRDGQKAFISIWFIMVLDIAMSVVVLCCSSLINVLYRVLYREWCIAIRIESWLSVSLHP